MNYSNPIAELLSQQLVSDEGKSPTNGMTADETLEFLTNKGGDWRPEQANGSHPHETNGMAKTELTDTQASLETRGVAIDRVGVKNVKFPVRIAKANGEPLHTVAEFALYVQLPADQRGTHMSRFMELLHESADVLSPKRLVELCEELRERLHAPQARIELTCPYFFEKKAPVTGVPSLLDCVVTMTADVGTTTERTLGIMVPTKSLCPCSKEISDYGAHNQRSEISANVRFDDSLAIEELITIIEKAASSPIYSLLKRPDERHVTQAAYDNPKFVEDIVRDLALLLDKEDRITWYAISAENYESIHNHEAYAALERTKK